MPRWPAAGSVLATTMTRSHSWPLEMNVFWPFSTYPAPSRTAVVWMPCRSLPAPGSLIAMAVISSPEQYPGSQRSFCSVLHNRAKYCPLMSLCTANPGPVAPARASSSLSIR